MAQFTGWHSPAYSAADNSAIDVTLTGTPFGDIPFTARMGDPESEDVYTKVLAGAEAIPIAAYVPPPPPPAPAKAGAAKEVG